MRAETVELRVTMDDGQSTAEQHRVGPGTSVAAAAGTLAVRAENLIHHVNVGCPLPIPHEGRRCIEPGDV